MLLNEHKDQINKIIDDIDLEIRIHTEEKCHTNPNNGVYNYLDLLIGQLKTVKLRLEEVKIGMSNSDAIEQLIRSLLPSRKLN